MFSRPVTKKSPRRKGRIIDKLTILTWPLMLMRCPTGTSLQKQFPSGVLPRPGPSFELPLPPPRRVWWRRGRSNESNSPPGDDSYGPIDQLTRRCWWFTFPGDIPKRGFLRTGETTNLKCQHTPLIQPKYFKIDTSPKTSLSSKAGWCHGLLPSLAGYHHLGLALIKYYIVCA